jgi:hypothetical protein
MLDAIQKHSSVESLQGHNQLNALTICEVAKMSTQTSITVVLANRPRLFRELLQHALNTASPQFRVVEAADAMPSSTVLREADWLVIDEESAASAEKLAATHPHLGILVLEGRGSRVLLLAPSEGSKWQTLPEVPTLSNLFSLLSHVPDRAAR